MPTRFRENKTWRQQWRQAVDRALVQGAIRVRDEVEATFASRGDGFLDGEYARGVAARSTQITPPFTVDGVRRVQVYNTANRDERPYVMFWELGHFNEWVGAYVRVETYRPALLQAADDVIQIMGRQISRTTKRPGTFSKGGGAELGVDLG